MPTYPTNYNDPSIALNNTTDKLELKNYESAGISNPTDTLADTATAINAFVAAVATQDMIPGIYTGYVVGGFSTLNPGNLTATDRKAVTSGNGAMMRKIQKKLLEAMRLMNQLNASIKGMGGAAGEQFGVQNYPSDKGKGW